MSALFVFIGLAIFLSLSIVLTVVSYRAFKGSLRKKEGIYYLNATLFFGLAMFEAIAIELLIDYPILATAYFAGFILCFLMSVVLALIGADKGNKSYNKIR